MHRILIVGSAIFCFYISSCGTRELDNNNARLSINVVDCLEREKTFNLSEYFDSIEYIRLETTDSSIFGRADKYAISDNHILIYDEQVGKILNFRRNGDFVGVFLNQGKGPQEFTSIGGLFFTQDGNVLVFKNNRTIGFFSIDGDLLKEFCLDKPSPRIGLLGDDKIAVFYPSPYCFYNEGFGLEIYSTNGVLERRLLKQKRGNTIKGAAAWNSVSYVNDTLCYWDAFSDRVISLTSNYDINDRWLIDMGDKGVSKRSISDGTFQNELSSKIVIDSWIENESLIIIDGVENRYLFSILFDKIKKTGYRAYYEYEIKDLGFHNDLDGGFPIWPGSFQKNRTMVSIVEASDFLYYTNTEYNKTIN